MPTKSFWIQLNGGSPWGFRIKETADNFLVVSRVNSKGRQQGIKEGDRILSVNGHSTADMTHSEAQRIIREAESELEMQLERIAEEIEACCFNGNGNMPSSVMSRLNAVDEDVHHTGSWSTDSTSTGSTTIQVSSFQSDSENVWSPSSKRANLRLNVNLQSSSQKAAPQEQAPPVPQAPPQADITAGDSAKTKDEDESPVWQPFGAPYDGPQFRPVKLEVTRTQRTATAIPQSERPKTPETITSEVKPEPPIRSEATSKEPTGKTSEDAKENVPEATPISPSSSAVFTKTGRSINLPPSQSPTITLLQKAREGQLPKGAVYIDEKSDLTPLPKNAVLIDQKVTVEGDKVHTDSYYAVPTLSTETTSYNVKAPPKYDGIGPTEYGIPVGLRTGVKEEYASDWYKTMYKSLHKQKFPNDTHTTVHLGGYMSEPEFERKDKHKEKHASDYRRMPEKSVSYTTEASSYDKSKISSTEPSVVRHEPKREAYRVEPRSIAEYEPGRNSLAEQEFHKFWSDFWDSMDDLHEHLGTSTKSQPGLNKRWPNVLLSDGYESDSTLIRKTGRSIEVDPDQQKSWYKEIQKGGEIPLTGLRKTVPEKPSENARFYLNPHIHGAEPPCSSHKHIPTTSLRTPTHTLQPLNRQPFVPFPPSHFARDTYVRTHDREHIARISRTPVPPKRHSTSVLMSTLTSSQSTPVVIESGKPNRRAGFPKAAESDIGVHQAKRYSWTNGCRESVNVSNEHSSLPFESSELASLCNGFEKYANGSIHTNITKYGIYKTKNHEPLPNGERVDFSQGPPNRSLFLKSCCHSDGQLNSNAILHENSHKPHVNHYGDGHSVEYTTLEDSKRLEDHINNRPICPHGNYCVKSTLPFRDDKINVYDTTYNSKIQHGDLYSNGMSSGYADKMSTPKISKSMPQFVDNINKDYSNNKREMPLLKENHRSSFKNVLNFAREMVSEIDTLDQKESTLLPRMITILPPVVRVSSNSELKPQIVHSKPQNNEKMSCTVDVKPLRRYLQKYGHTLPRKTTSTIGYDSTIELLLKDFQKAKSDLDSVRSPWMTNPQAELSKFLQVSNVNFDLNKIKNMKENGFNVQATNFTSNDSWKSNRTVTKNPCVNINDNFLLPHIKSPRSTHSIVSRNSNSYMKNSSIVYSEYIASMQRTASKSRSFTRLKNFYSSLEDIANSSIDNNKLSCYEIGKIDLSWKRVYFPPKWDKSQDRCLKVRHSSVEDLRQLFQGDQGNQFEGSKTTFQMSFQYKRLTRCGSVSNLIKKYNEMDLKIQSGNSYSINYSPKENWNCPSFNVINSEFHASIRSPFDYALPMWGTDSCIHNDFNAATHNAHFIDMDQHTFSTHYSSEETLLMPPHSKDVRNKVRFYEGIQQSNRSGLSSENKTYHKNLSCCDLSLEDQGISSRSSGLFSPGYLPERAVSCMDLSCMSADVSAIDPSTCSFDRTSSNASLYSSVSGAKSDIFNHGIKTGTVSLIKSKLEKHLPLSPKTQSTINNSKVMSCSVPDQLGTVATKKFRIGSGMSSSRSRSDSVQNLVQKFEQNKTIDTNSPIHPSLASNYKSHGYIHETSFNLKIGVANYVPYGCESNTNSLNWNQCKQANGVCWEALVPQSFGRRIQNMASKYEGIGMNVCVSKTTNFPNGSTQTSFGMEQFSNRRAPSVPERGKIQSSALSINRTTPGNSLIKSVRPALNGKAKGLVLKVQNSSPRPYIKSIGRTSEELHSASQHQYQETQVNIHYKSPIRHLEKEYIEEDELRKRQEDAMRKLYEEERKKKHIQEMAEIEMRRHGDFFTPSQKSPIPLNRYDNPFDTGYTKVVSTSLYTRCPQGKTMAKALYPFVSQTTRELNLSKGDFVYINKQIDKNWYEGEHHGLVGIFPVSYVEIIPTEKANFQPRKAMEGEAIVKYNFRAQTPMELSLFKGEKVVLIARKDHNWYEGRLGTKKGIFPISYVEVLQEPGEITGLRAISPRPPASPIFGSIVNGSPPKPIEGPTFTTGLRPLQDKPPLNLEKFDSKSSLTQSLHIDTYNEPIPYKSLYSYAPQNEDELELKEGDTVYVMEKCDDGWYVGTSLRTGQFGTFPGNYVERI